MSYSRHTCLEFPSRNPASPPHQKLTTRVPPGQLLTCPRSKRENQRICFKQGGIFVFPIPPCLCQKWVFFCRWGPHGYSMTQNSDDKRQKVSKRHQIPSAPLSQFTDAFLQLKTLQEAKNTKLKSSKYAENKKKAAWS